VTVQTVRKVLSTAALILSVAVSAAYAQTPSSVGATLKRLYPGTAFDTVAVTPVRGLSEVVMGGNVAYVDESGRYFLFGRLFDMQDQRDLTAERIDHVTRTDFSALPVDAAIVSVRGSGARKLAVFSDPDCPHCRALERELARLDDVTIYTFLYPLEALHPGARDKAIAVWCAPDRAKAWAALMLRGIGPTASSCDHPVDRNLALGSRLRVQGTPTLFAGDGRRHVGAQSAEEIDAWLRASAAVQAGAGQ
jgi:thiol:disulfide interchange protein DsbC